MATYDECLATATSQLLNIRRSKVPLEDQIIW